MFARLPVGVSQSRLRSAACNEYLTLCSSAGLLLLRASIMHHVMCALTVCILIVLNLAVSTWSLANDCSCCLRAFTVCARGLPYRGCPGVSKQPLK